MVSLPRLLIAAPSTGQGKTTVATGLMAALRATGLTVSGHKVGPDYIDPGYHALATGRPGRNLDPHLVGEDLVVPLLLHGASTPERGELADLADIAVIEGVMGLHDGRLGTDGFASTAHLARLTDTPVVLVIDCGRLSRSAAAIAAGMAVFDPRVRIAGVVLNRAGSDRNTEEITRALASWRLPVVGRLPYDAELASPSRHLGLVPVAERGESAALIERLGAQVAAHLDLHALLEIAASAPDLDAVPWDPSAVVRPVASGRRPVVAVAGGRAFTFRYPETEELLRAAGCDVVPFDPLHDEDLPAGVAGLHLGGGFPEIYAGELAGNARLMARVREAVGDGVPTVAECAGLLYLCRTLDGVPMAGAVPLAATMSPRLTLRYPVATAASDSLLTRRGERVSAHEFHRTVTDPVATEPAAWIVDGAPTGVAGPRLHASYLHVHWAGYPQLAQRFAEAVAVASGAGAGSGTADGVADPLRHHGDREVGGDLLDLAVNVHPGPRPEWLDRALHASIGEAAAYPDVAPAVGAVAAHAGRLATEVLVTAGAAEAFTLIARLRPWQRPVVVHPQFTEPHAALESAGHRVTPVLLPAETGFALDPALVPQDADLVVVGNPTNPTGVLHPAEAVLALRRPGRVVVIDEAFMDAVPDEAASLARTAPPDVVVLRSLTKLWGIPGVRAGYVLAGAEIVAELARLQTPWAVSTAAIAATRACLAPEAAPEARARAADIAAWRTELVAALAERGVEVVPSSTSFVLARLGAGTRERLREHGIAVRRCDTFPGLDATWCRIAVRPPATTARLLAALEESRV